MINKNEIFEHLMDKMFEFAQLEIKYNEVKNRNDEWYLKYTMTSAQCEEWLNYGRYYLMKKGFSKYFAIKEMNYLNLMLGLKIME